LPHVDAWNTWFDEYRNTPDGYGTLRDRIDTACAVAGRDPAEIARSVCTLVAIEGGAGERALPEGMRPVTGSMQDVAAHVRALADLGAAEVIIVADPITEASIRTLGGALRILRA
jgi:alkanesulfonate monooxygenase SsuD/methylene tetrahydromethanopterin reductase-like flavin-dependent oxidoreductase (luciferase family)